MSYIRTSEKRLLEEYMKAVNLLTINEENRLKIKLGLLESEKTNYEKLDAKIDALQRAFLKNNTMVGPAGSTEDEWRHMTEEEIEQEIHHYQMRRKLTRKAQIKLMQELENEKSKND